MSTADWRTICGRSRELHTLQALVDSPRPEFLAVYGRRRVGKTFLLRQFFGSRARLFEVTGRHNATMADNLLIFSEALARSFHQDAALRPPESWHAAFAALRTELERVRPANKKWVLFIDELPWLATHKSGCLEELDHFWNSWCSKQPNVILIVCGSAASWMLKHIVHAHGGLHNRITASMQLMPFSLSEAHAFLHSRKNRLTHNQLVELYMAIGGVPHYLDKVPRGVSVAQAIDAMYFDDQGPLTHEFEHLFASLFSDGDKYRQIVQQLASKRSGMTRGQLLAAVGLRSGGGANRTLDNLERSGFIRTFIPFGYNQRNRYYRLTDELSLFHLYWIKSRGIGKKENWSALRNTSKWASWASLAFETLCLKHVHLIEQALGISGVNTETSSWQHRSKGAEPGAQIDLLIDRADDVISVCELKHTNHPFSITKHYAMDLRRKLAVLKEQTGTRKGLQLVLITSSGLLENEYSRDVVDKHVTLDALFAKS